MKKEKQVREPRQKRSEQTKEKILNTAFELFCQKGYYKTSTNEIARTADISIGNLYFYYPNKETIFLDILDQYHQSFQNIHEVFLHEMEYMSETPMKFLRKIIDMIIENHEKSFEFNREIQIMCLSSPIVAAVLNKQQIQTEETILCYFEKCRDKLQVEDLEAAASITYTLINSVVDQIVFAKNKIDRERLLNETVHAVGMYLLGNQCLADEL